MKNNSNEKIITQTERLIIRQFQDSDLEALAQILGKPEVMKFSPVGELSKEMTRIRMQGYIDSYEKHGYGKWAVIHRESGRLIGYCGIAVTDIEGKLENELGYRFDPDFWGQGLATEAAKACLQYGFDQLNFDYVLAIVEPENYGSVRVLEKIGMEFVKESNSVWQGKVVSIYQVMRE